MKTSELFAYDRAFDVPLLAGMDEAGRGPLAGPVVCACCILPPTDPIEGINDSKKLSESKRERVYERIVAQAVDWSVAVIDAQTVDEINILQATKRGMRQAVEGLSVVPQLLLVDAVKNLEVAVPYRSIIRGDAQSYAIAAASIVAKVTRDRLLREYDACYPQYGFARHKGYGTAAHIAAIGRYGACAIHRRTFIKKFLPGQGGGDDAQ